MFHLERAVEQLNNAMEYASDRKQRPPGKKAADQLLRIGVYLLRLEENAAKNGKTGLAMSLAKPFQRLLKYHVMFGRLLFCIDPVTPEYDGALQMVTEVETILGSIEDGRILREEHHRTWDVLGRIDGLDAVRQFVAPKPSRILVEERKPPFKHLSDTLQTANPDGTGGEWWFVVFNDVVLRCQRTGAVLLPRWGASYPTTYSTPMAWVEATRRRPHSQLGTLYKFLKACFIANTTPRDFIDELYRSRHGMLADSLGCMEWLQPQSALSRSRSIFDSDVRPIEKGSTLAGCAVSRK